MDFLSLHRYYGYKGDVTAYLASYADLDAFLSAGIAAADYVKAYKRSKKVMKISLDEWNAWYCDHGAQEPWTVAPALEEQTYNVMDALCVGGLLCTMINRSDRVRMGCLAQLVNCLRHRHDRARQERLRADDLLSLPARLALRPRQGGPAPAAQGPGARCRNRRVRRRGRRGDL